MTHATTTVLHSTCTDLVIDTDGYARPTEPAVTFDTTVYSRIKYGSKKYAHQYGTLLGNKLLADHDELLLAVEPPVAVVVYQVIPPACYALSHAAMSVINKARLKKGLAPGRVVRIHKGEILTKEYAAEPLAVRQKILENIQFDTLDNDFSAKVVLFMDDVRITGNTERKVCETIAPHHPAAILCGYIAQFDEQQAINDPMIETRMNSSYVQSLLEVADIINKDGFAMNIRVLKRILCSNEQPHLQQFLSLIPSEVISEILVAAEQSGLANDPQFSENYKIISNFTKK